MEDTSDNSYQNMKGNDTEHFPPDVETLPDMHPFYKDLADLIDKHAEDEEERYRFLCACVAFGEYWKSDPGGW